MPDLRPLQEMLGQIQAQAMSLSQMPRLWLGGPPSWMGPLQHVAKSPFAGHHTPFVMNPIPLFKFPVIRIPKPWYEGENVCKEVKVSHQPDEFKTLLGSEDASFGNGDFSSTSRSCRGGNNKFICMDKITSSTGSKLVVTKYSCCPGFVRPHQDGSPGCVKG